MDIADLAASAVKKITTGKGKRLAKKGYPEDLPKVQPVTISNKDDGKFDVGFAMKETMPDDFDSKTYYCRSQDGSENDRLPRPDHDQRNVDRLRR